MIVWVFGVEVLQEALWTRKGKMTGQDFDKCCGEVTHLVVRLLSWLFSFSSAPLRSCSFLLSSSRFRGLG